MALEGYKLPDNGKSFSKEELAETYMLSSLEQIEKDNPKAAGLVNDWIQKKELSDNRAVYCTWREGIDIVEKESVNLDSTNTFLPKIFKTAKHTGPCALPSKKVYREFGEAEPYEPKADSARTHKRVLRQKHWEEASKRERNSEIYRPPRTKLAKLPYSILRVHASRKYKPVALKIRPVKTDLPEEFRVKRHIIGDPLADLPTLPTHPPEFTPKGRYTEERKEIIDKNHDEDFLTEEEMKLVHWLMSEHNEAFS